MSGSQQQQQTSPQPPQSAEDRRLGSSPNQFQGSDDEDDMGHLKKSPSSPDSSTDRKSGRRKINIEFIEDKSRRHITFSKRKAGIMKKAYELSTLTGTQVLLLVASETGHVYTFATPKLQPLITKPEGKNLIQACLNAPDAAPQQAPSPQQRMPQQSYDPNLMGFPQGPPPDALEGGYEEDKKDRRMGDPSKAYPMPGMDVNFQTGGYGSAPGMMNPAIRMYPVNVNRSYPMSPPPPSYYQPSAAVYSSPQYPPGGPTQGSPSGYMWAQNNGKVSVNPNAPGSQGQAQGSVQQAPQRQPSGPLLPYQSQPGQGSS